MVEARFPCKIMAVRPSIQKNLTNHSAPDAFKATTNEIVSNAKGMYDQVCIEMRAMLAVSD